MSGNKKVSIQDARYNKHKRHRKIPMPPIDFTKYTNDDIILPAQEQE